MAYSVYTTESFDKEFGKLNKSDQEILDKMFKQLTQNPNVGDQLRFPFFREKRLREKRVYYLIYDDLSAVLMVAIGGKKAQQTTIDQIVNLLPEFKQYMKKLLENS